MHIIFKRIGKDNLVKLVISTILIIGGAVIADHYSKMHHRDVSTRLISLGADLIFIIFAILFTHVFSKGVKRIISAQRLGAARAASTQFIIRIVGYIVILLVTLNFLNVPIGKLLLGGAVIGIILGVAAQQALANFFASIVLTISHPFSVGQEITITSGALGGEYKGTIKDIGLTHTLLKEEDGKKVMLPNATILSSSTIRVHNKHEKPTDKSEA